MSFHRECPWMTRCCPGTTQVSLEGASENRIEVRVGSPGFIRDACPRDAAFDPVLEQLFRPQATRTVDHGEQRDAVSVRCRAVHLQAPGGEDVITRRVICTFVPFLGCPLDGFEKRS